MNNFVTNAASTGNSVIVRTGPTGIPLPVTIGAGVSFDGTTLTGTGTNASALGVNGSTVANPNLSTGPTIMITAVSSNITATIENTNVNTHLAASLVIATNLSPVVSLNAWALNQTNDTIRFGGTITNTVLTAVPFFAVRPHFDLADFEAYTVLRIAPTERAGAFLVGTAISAETTTNSPYFAVTPGGTSIGNASDAASGGVLTLSSPLNSSVLTRISSWAKDSTATTIDIGHIDTTWITNTHDLVYPALDFKLRRTTTSPVLYYRFMPDLMLGPAATFSNVVTAASFLATTDNAYGAGWNGSLRLATENAIYDKVETIIAGGNQTPWASDIDGGGFSLTNAASITLVSTNAGQMDFNEASANGTSVVALKAPDSLGSTVTNTLPSTDGTLANSANNLSFFAATTGAQLASVLSNETGTGVPVFSSDATVTNFSFYSSGTNWDTLRLLSPTNFASGIKFFTGVGATDTRNWGVGINNGVNGDFVIRESSTNTTDPFIAGTTRLQLLPGGGAVLSGALTVAGITNTDLTASLPVFTDANKKLSSTGTIDSSVAGTVLKQTKYLQLTRPDYGDGAGAIPQTNSYVASGLMHFTMSGNAETNVNWTVYEFDCPADLDTTVAMTATYSFLSGGTDADAYVFHLTYEQAAVGAAYATGTTIDNLPIVMSVTPTTAANGDIQQSAATTLTGWAAAMTPGLPMQVRVARLQNTQDDGSRDVSLRIAFGSTQ